MSGAKDARITEAIVNDIRTAMKDSLNVSFAPRTFAKIPLISALPTVTRTIRSGNFIAT
jgi:hypothetical protein